MAAPDPRGSDPDAIRLLQGENPLTDDLEEIKRWVRVYSTLVAGGAGVAVSGSQADPWRDRLAFWERRYRLRRAELA